MAASTSPVPLDPSAPPRLPATFCGYPRPVGRAGVRNHLLVLSIAGLTGPAARRVARVGSVLRGRRWCIT